MFIKVFSDYINYFTDEKIASQYTMREWWSKCSVLHNLQFDFYAPFSDLFSEPPTQVNNLMLRCIFILFSLLIF